VTSLLEQCRTLGDLGDDLCSDYAKMRARRLGLNEADMVRLTLHYLHSGEQHETALMLAAQELGHA
jgi:hypothetical protein